MIENAVLTGAYRPQDDDVNRASAVVKDSGVEPGEDLDDPEVFGTDNKWNSEQLGVVSERILALNGVMNNILARKYTFRSEDREDIISVATMRFLERVSDGRLPTEYDDKHLVRLLAKFVEHSAIDVIRTARGRNGQKPQVLSYDMPIDNSQAHLVDVKEMFADSSGIFEEFNATDTSAVKKLMPHLSERQRRILILQSYFGLKHFEIAQIMGSTEGAVAQAVVGIKIKSSILRDKGEV